MLYAEICPKVRRHNARPEKYHTNYDFHELFRFKSETFSLFF